ncbi:MAG: cobalt-precorrin-5B (C(1))-methyltransferase [Pseudomonadota bacterium]|nr:cobalt-precorrin-5B (C(1))-methyltransferase [Pseudomonadota bacterium]
MARKPDGELRRGWTTGACATAAAKAAYTALLTGEFPDPVQISLPNGETPSFCLVREGRNGDTAYAAIVKDAGDDPDVTHGAIVQVDIAHGAPGSGVTFRAGNGVGTVTRKGLPLAIGEPAINPAPRTMIRNVIAKSGSEFGGSGDVTVTISVDGGAKLAEKTWNPRLGILGGISILGTTGVVIPYSCSAWIESIHRGVDVARAAGEQVVAGCTGRTSEKNTQALLGLPDHAMIDMGDFAGGMLKYLRTHPVPTTFIGGGFAKIAKLAQGNMDLHSGRSRVDPGWLADIASTIGATPRICQVIRTTDTAAQILEVCQDKDIPLGREVARQAATVALSVLESVDVDVNVLIFDRKGRLVGRYDG